MTHEDKNTCNHNSDLSTGQQLRSMTTTPFPPLAEVGRTHVSTEQAAFYLNRRPQTLREWAMSGKVIMPLRVNGRLAWPVFDIKRVLGVM